MKLSVFYDHILQAKEQSGKSLEELLRGVRAAGIDAVEICLTYLLEHKETLKLLQDADLGISCIYEFFAMESQDETQKLVQLIETAEEVKAGRVLVVPGFVSEEEKKEMQACMKDYEKVAAYMDSNTKVLRMAEGLSFVAKLGMEKGVIVTVEDFDDNKSPLSGMNGIRWFLNRIPELQYTLDMGNFITNGEDVIEAWKLLKDRVVHVHCKDRGEVSVAVGDGYLPIAELVQCLRATGYDNYFAIEHFDAEEQELCMRKSADFLRKIGV